MDIDRINYNFAYVFTIIRVKEQRFKKNNQLTRNIRILFNLENLAIFFFFSDYNFLPM